jgi:hypothetical protein
MIHKPDTDSVIDEIHRVRHEIADRFENDISAIAADADSRAENSGRPIWKPADNKSMNQSRGG